jgi:hypothetical protein
LVISWRHFASSFSWRALGELAFAPAQVFKESLAINRFDATAFDIVVAAIQHIPHFSDFSEISSHGVFYEIIGWAAALNSQLV